MNTVTNVLKKLPVGKRRSKRNIAKLITGEINPVYDIAEVYLRSLVSNSYDKSWYLFYKYIAKKDLNIHEVESSVNELLLRPTKAADNFYESATVTRLLFILESEGKLENIERDKLETWLGELEKRDWYGFSLIAYSAEFHAFFASLSGFRERNPYINKVLNSDISRRIIRPMLWILFGLSLDNSGDIQAKVKHFVEKLVKEYSGMIWDTIIKRNDIEFFAIYLYLVSKYKLYDEIDRVYPEFEKQLFSILLSSDWIIQAIEAARNIQLGRSDEDVIVIRPGDIPTIYPKILALSLIAIYEAGYDSIAVLPAKYQKLAQRIREEGLIGIPKNSLFLKTYTIYFLACIILIQALSTIAGYCFGQTKIGVISGLILNGIHFILRHYYIKPELIDLEK